MKTLNIRFELDRPNVWLYLSICEGVVNYGLWLPFWEYGEWSFSYLPKCPDYGSLWHPTHSSYDEPPDECPMCHNTGHVNWGMWFMSKVVWPLSRRWYEWRYRKEIADITARYETDIPDRVYRG